MVVVFCDFWIPGRIQFVQLDVPSCDSGGRHGCGYLFTTQHWRNDTHILNIKNNKQGKKKENKW